MLERDPGSRGDGREPHLHLGRRRGWSAGEQVGEHETVTRLPHQHPAPLDPLTRLRVVHLEKPAADARLEPHPNRSRRILEAVRAALVPDPDVLGEDLEGGGGIDGDRDARHDRRAVAHTVPPRARSAWALNEPSCSAQNACTWSSQAWRAAKRSGRRWYIRRRASSSTSSASTSPLARSTLRWRLIAGALISTVAASSPARRGPSRSRSTTIRRVGSASADSVASRSRRSFTSP